MDAYVSYLIGLLTVTLERFLWLQSSSDDPLTGTMYIVGHCSKLSDDLRLFRTGVSNIESKHSHT